MIGSDLVRGDHANRVQLHAETTFKRYIMSSSEAFNFTFLDISKLSTNNVQKISTVCEYYVCSQYYITLYFVTRSGKV